MLELAHFLAPRPALAHPSSPAALPPSQTFNEPSIHTEDYSDFAFALRSEAYRWAKAERPRAPVLSCWDDHNATDAVDRHAYTGNMSYISAVTLSNPAKGGLITESGCRCTAPPPTTTARP